MNIKNLQEESTVSLPENDPRKLGLLNLYDLTFISREIAQTLSRFHGKTLWLNSIKYISTESAKALSNWKGDQLALDGLESLSADAAIELTRFSGKNLSMDSLTSISSEASEALSNWRGNTLSMDGLTSISGEASEALSGWRGNTLSLDRLTSLPVEVAHAFSKWTGDLLSLSSITFLSDESAQELFKWTGTTLFLGLQYLPTRSAQCISKWGGELHGLYRLKGLSKEAANALVNKKNIEFLLSYRHNHQFRQLLINSLEIHNKEENEELHSDDGPAIVLPNGCKVYAIHGVLVPRYVVENPQQITIDQIDNNHNTEIRRILIEKYGWHRYIRNGKVKKLANDKYGSLYKKYYNNDDIFSFVKVKNSTPEPDGAFKSYYLQVPPDFMTAHEAVAWTFGLTADEYQPEVET